ncbi:aminotransferase class IV [Aestuariibaculum sediminum]|uniref:branched-chain-amino-acid transaminase n=1 Tax=Aestuariibaculum sediminum TaxID=2770637 RepID=A0A8J6Q235_9FLAO|nr:aminotransferase class IV [Aestuariibaculum sediminum]MBD0831656.1 aminotransferase class IV [Aestuariibaculum sediminum]
MTNYNGNILAETNTLSIQNRGYAYGDALFETIKASHGKLLFWEDHYFRLMASMRILRMEIPMNFTMEYLEDQMLKTLEANNLMDVSARVKLTVHRAEGGLYLPQTNAVGYNISVKPLENDFYELSEGFYEIDLFKDYFVSPSLLSTLKSNNKALNVVGSIYAKENALNNCLVLNTNKHVVEALNGNVFLVKGKTIKTPPISDGCLKGIMRKQIIDVLKNWDEYDLIEESVSPFELQKSDEIFITNVISGIIPVSKYRKKAFKHEVAQAILNKLNIKVRLS